MVARLTNVATYELQNAADFVAALMAVREHAIMRPTAVIMSLNGLVGRSHRCLECPYLSDIRE